MHARFTRRRRGAASALAVGLTLAVLLPTAVLGDHGFPNPAPYVAFTAAVTGGQIVPLINSGDEYHDITFEGIPDGIGVVPGTGTIDLYVTHEQSHVPFSGFADFQDSSVSRVTVTTGAIKQVVGLEVALSPDLGFIRFCSAFMAGPEQGFDTYTFLANEESNDIIEVPANAPYGADPAVAPYRQAGYSVALDTSDDSVTVLSRMGRHNHENTVVVPGGWKWTATLSGDDTFTAPSSQLYLHTANDPEQLLSDKGQLWALQVTAVGGVAVDGFDAFNGANDYLDISGTESFSGRFIHVPTDVARGLTDEAPQAALENWSNANNIFQFIRVEDIAYDSDNPRTVYFADTGAAVQASTATSGPTAGRLVAGGANQRGRVFKMVLNAKDPRIVDSLTILADGNNASSNFNRPDNIAVSHSSIMVQEDTGNAKVWRYDLATSAWTHVASATQPTAETSGIVDVSQWLGAGWWALDVQSHINKDLGPSGLTYVTPITGATLTYQTRREDGQLLLMQIPGS
jgi:hypothetical protein